MMQRAFTEGGWPFVERRMASQIEGGVSTPEAYLRYFQESGLIDSWNTYVAWTKEHPGQPVPPEIARIGGKWEPPKALSVEDIPEDRKWWNK